MARADRRERVGRGLGVLARAARLGARACVLDERLDERRELVLELDLVPGRRAHALVVALHVEPRALHLAAQALDLGPLRGGRVVLRAGV